MFKSNRINHWLLNLVHKGHASFHFELNAVFQKIKNVEYVQVELFRNDQHRIKIVVDSENEVDLFVQTRHLRDVIVLVIRGIAQRFNSTSLNTLLKMET